MWATSAVYAETRSLSSFGLPPHRSVDSYFANVGAGSAAMLIALIVLSVITYAVMIKRDGNLSQFFGYVLILVWLAIFGPTGSLALRGVLVGIWQIAWAWLTG